MTSSSVRPGNRAKSSSPGRRLRRQIFQICRLLLREPDAAQLLIAQLENAFRSERLSCQRREAIENGYRRFAVQLLVDNRFGQAAELGQSKLHAAWPHALDDGAQYGVRLFEVVHSLSHDLDLYIYHKDP